MFFSLDQLSKWLSAKSPRKKKFILSQKNIYIFPSSFGLAFLVLLLLMLLTAINYQSSLIYLFTFFLGVIFFLSIWGCFLNFSGLNVEVIEPGRCFERELVQYKYRISRTNRLPLALKVGIDKDIAEPIPFTIHSCLDLTLVSPRKTRGRHKLDRIYIETRFPFGLVLAWTWLKLDAECWVYPSPVFSYPNSSTPSQGDKNTESLSSEELNDLRTYQHGDPTGRILWKKFASKDELIIRTQEYGSYSPEWVDWDHYEGSTEEKLRHLCFDVCQLSEGSKPYGFKLPGLILTPDFGSIHKQKCLDALALFEQ